MNVFINIILKKNTNNTKFCNCQIKYRFKQNHLSIKLILLTDTKRIKGIKLFIYPAF